MFSRFVEVDICAYGEERWCQACCIGEGHADSGGGCYGDCAQDCERDGFPPQAEVQVVDGAQEVGEEVEVDFGAMGACEAADVRERGPPLGRSERSAGSKRMRGEAGLLEGPLGRLAGLRRAQAG